MADPRARQKESGRYSFLYRPDLYRFRFAEAIRRLRGFRNRRAAELGEGQGRRILDGDINDLDRRALRQVGVGRTNEAVERVRAVGLDLHAAVLRNPEVEDDREVDDGHVAARLVVEAGAAQGRE